MLNRFAQFNICILNSVKLFNEKVWDFLFTTFFEHHLKVIIIIKAAATA